MMKRNVTVTLEFDDEKVDNERVTIVDRDGKVTVIDGLDEFDAVYTALCDAIDELAERGDE